MGFGNDFLWGAATAAAQIEGGWTDGGRTPSIWDMAPSQRIRNGETCHDGCDHYHRVEEDVALMKEIGLRSYRFSVSWSRILPREGVVNPEGVRFYVNLAKQLRENGIEPIVTLFHWDLPLWVQEKGGWLSEETPALFAAYTRVVVEALSDRVTYWIPMNEPQCFILIGHVLGIHAPFRRRVFSIRRMTEICLAAHAEAVRVIRRAAKTPPKIGIAMAAGAYLPRDESPREIEKARRQTFGRGLGQIGNRWWSDPIFRGDAVSLYGLFRIGTETAERFHCDMDFIGLNVYRPFGSRRGVPAERKTSMGWVINGQVLYYALRFFHERYGLPLLVTENGMADHDVVAPDGGVHDEKRIGFLREYLAQLERAVDEGIPVLGYQYWSLMDNFEWAEGYAPRFGLIHVDYATKRRTLKDSAYYYQQVIRDNQ